MHGRTIRTGALTAALALSLGSGAAGGATLEASYQLQGTRASQIAGAPDLTDLGPGNAFATETVAGAARQVLTFPRGGGVSLPTAGLVDPTSHSITMVFRLDETSGWRRLLDFRGGVSDNGFYDYNGQAQLYLAGALATSPGIVFTPGAYVRVTLTSEATAGGGQRTQIYIGGTPVTWGNSSRGFTLDSGVLRVFKDNDSGPATGEESGGALACLLLYDGALTAAEVAHESSDPARCPSPRPAAPPRPPVPTGAYVGITRQRLPISFTVGTSSVQQVRFGWRARCADGIVHTNTISLGSASIVGSHFSVGPALLNTGGYASVSGRLVGNRAFGVLSRWGDSAFGTSCSARGVRWRARLGGRWPAPF
jgi:hypothetical protein